MNSGLLLLLLATSACSTTPSSPSLERGEWTADVEVPGLAAAIGLLVHVPQDLTAQWRLTGLAAHGIDVADLNDVQAADGRVEFTWARRTQRHCVLESTGDGGYAGPCTAAEQPTWRFRMEPPSRRDTHTGLARSALAHPDFAWNTLDTDDVRVHGSGASDLEAVATRARAAIRANLDLLGADGYDRPVDVFLIESREEMQLLTGLPSAGYASPLSSDIVLTGYGASKTSLVHEMMHVLSVQKWGVPAAPWAWVLEGLATWSARTCASRPLHDVAAYMNSSGMLLPMSVVMNEFHEHDDVITYLQSASFLGWLLETHGRDLTKDVWQRGMPAAFTDAGMTLDSAERDWLAMLEARSTPATGAEWEAIREGGCR